MNFIHEKPKRKRANIRNKTTGAIRKWLEKRVKDGKVAAKPSLD